MKKRTLVTRATTLGLAAMMVLGGCGSNGNDSSTGENANGGSADSSKSSSADNGSSADEGADSASGDPVTLTVLPLYCLPQTLVQYGVAGEPEPVCSHDDGRIEGSSACRARQRLQRERKRRRDRPYGQPGLGLPAGMVADEQLYAM